VKIHSVGTPFQFNLNQGGTMTLYYHKGSSDKIYQISIAEKHGGYVVNFAFGRRGSTLQTGTKTNAPVSFDVAKKIYDKLVQEKMAKGYTPGANGTPYSGSDNAQRSTGVLPQLLNSIDEAHAEKLIADPAFWLQQKHDGKRVLVQCQDGMITGINRKGLSIDLPESIVTSAQSIGKACIIDGEAIADRLYAFDLLSLNGVDYRLRPYSDRHEKLFGLIEGGVGSIELVETHCTESSKSDAFARLKRTNAEGVVFKLADAPYTPGRPASGGPQLKFKFVATGSFIVAGVNSGKRSVGLEVLNALGQSQYIGNVTIPANHKMPKVGALAEIRYLYCFREGCLHQPLFLGIRDDIDINTCTIAQLKYRPEENDDSE
jgi:bifunctional non-homologous end joining protein LigD